MPTPNSNKIDSLKRKQEEELTKQKAEAYSLPYLDLSSTPIDKDAFSLVSEEETGGEALIIKEGNNIIQIATSNPNSPVVKNLLQNMREKYARVDVFLVSKSATEEAWEDHKKPRTQTRDITGSVDVSGETLERFKKQVSTLDDFQKALDDIADKNASHIFELILSSTLAMEATDIHIEPQEGGTVIRLKIDGILYEAGVLSERLYKLVLSRVKLLSQLKLNVHDTPQEGRFSVTFEERVIEIRASILPSEYNEDIALRVLDPKFLLSLSDLGIRDDLLKKLKSHLSTPQGIIFVTGPTGSGKTTTLYACILHLNTSEVKIITIEDPIEYHVRGTTQTQVNEDEDYTFSAGLKAILRQDPDIVLIGELREAESSEVALQAALAGRQVLTTLHAIDASGTTPRLMDFGIDPATISSALSASIAQRLIRKLCEACKAERSPSEEESKNLQTITKNLPEDIKPNFSSEIKVYSPRGGGCPECRGTGYKGRVGIFEILSATDTIKKKISEGPAENDLREFAIENGMTTIEQDAALKILNGATSFEEVERVLGKLDKI